MKKYMIGLVMIIVVLTYNISNADVSVRKHMRSSPNSTPCDNWSTYGNENPHTGSIGTKRFSECGGGGGIIGQSAPVNSAGAGGWKVWTKPAKGSQEYELHPCVRIKVMNGRIQIATLCNSGTITFNYYGQDEKPIKYHNVRAIPFSHRGDPLPAGITLIEDIVDRSYVSPPAEAVYFRYAIEFKSPYRTDMIPNGEVRFKSHLIITQLLWSIHNSTDPRVNRYKEKVLMQWYYELYGDHPQWLEIKAHYRRKLFDE